MMDEFSGIIGYEPVKEEMERIIDVLKEPERYAKLGVTAPQGLLLHGKPGVGKTSLAKCFMEAVGLPSVICKKLAPNGEFVKEIKRAFDEALDCAPSVLLLDDMDKFANDDEGHRNSEEYVTVQACIDDVKGKGVFVLATTNNLGNMPHSLIRSGRFDRIIRMREPDGDDAACIIGHYLKDKAVADDVDASTIAALLGGRSCADLESVINQAGILAGYDREERISFKNVINACLIKFHDVPLDCLVVKDRSPEKLWNTAGSTYWHEAGHAAMNELLLPGSVVFAYANADRHVRGFVKATAKKLQRCDHAPDALRIMVSLAGKAAVDLMLGVDDDGVGDDLETAHQTIDSLNDEYAYSGHVFSAPDMSESSAKRHMREVANATLLQYFYGKVKRSLAENRDFLEKIAQKLYKDSVLTQSDMKTIRETCDLKQPLLI